MMSGLYQYGNKQGNVGKYMGTIFAFINYSTQMSKFMQFTRLFQHKIIYLFHFRAEICQDELPPITSYINHESAEIDFFLAESHRSMKLQKLE